MQVQTIRRRVLWGCVALALVAWVLWYSWDVEGAMLLRILVGAIGFTLLFALAGVVVGGLLISLRWWLRRRAGRR